MQTQSTTNSALAGLVYLLVAIICAGLSSWSTFHGLALLQQQIAALIATVIFLALFLCHYVVLRRRQEGGLLLRQPFGLIGPLVLLLFVTALSASSSFAYFYNLALRDRIAVSQAQLAGETFESNATLAEAALGRADKIRSIRDALELQFTNLTTEVFGAGRNGFGDRAMGYVGEIQRIMTDARRPIVLPEFPPPGSSEPQNRAAYDRLHKAVFANLEAFETNDEVNKALSALKKVRADASKTVAQMRSVDAISFEERRAGIEELAGYTVDMERIVNSALDDDQKSIALKPVSADGIGLTNIVEVYRWAFGEGRYVGISVMSMFLALMLDLLPFIIAMVLLRQAPDSPMRAPEDARSESREPGKSSGRGSTITKSSHWR